MKSEFHVIFTFREIFFFWLYPQPLQNIKTILSSQAIQNQVGGWIWPTGHSMQTPVRDSFLPLLCSCFKQSSLIKY